MRTPLSASCRSRAKTSAVPSSLPWRWELFLGSMRGAGVETVDAALVAAIGELDHGGGQHPVIDEPIEEIGLDRIQGPAGVEGRLGRRMVGLRIAAFVTAEESFVAEGFQEGRHRGPAVGIVDVHADRPQDGARSPKVKRGGNKFHNSAEASSSRMLVHQRAFVIMALADGVPSS